MAFLGEVHQMEEDRECAGNLLGSLDGELVDDAPRLVAVATPPRVTCGTAQSFDIAEQVAAAGFSNDITEQRPKQPHFAAQALEAVLGHDDTLGALIWAQ